MNRRDYLKLASAAAMSPLSGVGVYAASGEGPAKLECTLARLNLRHTWTTTMSSSEYRETVQLSYSKDGGRDMERARQSFVIRSFRNLRGRRSNRQRGPSVREIRSLIERC